ncbi:MAG TPA: hypothetical protein VD969_18435 [Symbiobacteriaceae bacterium]|nr:hypothetical protein [Symbiobacteriaceae bacterium]
MNMSNMMHRDVLKTTAVGTGLGAAGGWGVTATLGGVTVAVTGTAMAMPVVAAGAVLGGLMGLAYGMGRRMQ